MIRFLILLLGGLLLTGCTNSSIDVQATDQDAHQQLFEEEEETNARITQRARVVSVPPAEYPDPAPEPGLSGMIMIRVLVSEDGQAIETRVNQSLHPALDEAARAAAMAGSYAPAREGEIPRETWISVPFRYPPPETEQP